MAAASEVEPVVNGEVQEPNDHINGHVNEPNCLINGYALTNGSLSDGPINRETLTNGVSNGSRYTSGHLTPDEKPRVNGIVNEIHASDLLITQLGKPDSIADELSVSLSETIHWKPSVYPLGEIDCTRKHVVLLQTGARSLRDLTIDAFDSIKKTLLNASNLLWVYRLDNPAAQMIVGLTRSVRSEILAKVATLGLEPAHLRKPTAPIMAAIDVLWRADGAKPCKDFEFHARGPGSPRAESR